MNDKGRIGMLVWIGSRTAQDRWNRKVLFLDRDGILNVDRPGYIKGWHEFEFYPDALPALRWLAQNKIGAVLVSNQSAINRGLISWDDFWDVHHRMLDLIRAEGGYLAGALYCPHRPDENCFCRKPSPAMILTMCKVLGTRPEDTFMVGDRPTDIQAARNAGCRPILLERRPVIDSAGEASAEMPDVQRFKTLTDAVQTLFGDRKAKEKNH